MFSGSIVALITPFKNGQVDYNCLGDLVNWQIEEGSQGIVACGTTGEVLFLDLEERQKVLKGCLEAAAGRVPVIMGCGAPGTAETVSLAKAAASDGADALLVVTPYYVKPSPKGTVRHFEEVNNATDLPVIIYNNPARAVIDIPVNTVVEMSKLSNIVGIKDASADLSRPVKLRELVDKDFCLLSGEDPTSMMFLAQGGHGCISMAANAAPRKCQDVMDAWSAGDLEKFGKLRDELLPFYEAMVIETNPTPVKYAVSKLGRCENTFRLPLVPISSESEKTIDSVMQSVGLI